MKNILKGIIFVFLFIPFLAFASEKFYEPKTPENFSPIPWVSAPGINSFFRTPKESGAIDYLTRIYLPQNQINFIASKNLPIDLTLNELKNSFDILPFENEGEISNLKEASTLSDFHNLSFERMVVENFKSIDPSIKFIWDVAFFNMNSGFSDLSMAAKYSINGVTTITSGSRSFPDMAIPRKMILINNKTAEAEVKNFDPSLFINPEADQAIEGFAPLFEKTGNDSYAASRLFLGISSDGKELVVYCSKLATVKEASDALLSAGIPIENQIQADGGGSTSCGYNLPGQYFVEPTRTLPILMGAKTIVFRGKVISDTLNVRNGPSIREKIVEKIPKNTEIIAFEEKNGWYKIGENKWISKTLVK